MRTPTSLDDRCLLEDEPFKSHFENLRTPYLSFQARDKLFEQLRKQKGSRKALEGWCSLCFKQEEQQTQREFELRSKPKPARGRKTKELPEKMWLGFIQFYWGRFNNEDVLSCLRKVKTMEGFTLINHLAANDDGVGRLSPLTVLSDDEEDGFRPSSSSLTVLNPADIITPKMEAEEDKLLPSGTLTLPTLTVADWDYRSPTAPLAETEHPPAFLADTPAHDLLSKECAIPGPTPETELPPILRTPPRARSSRIPPARCNGARRGSPPATSPPPAARDGITLPPQPASESISVRLPIALLLNKVHGPETLRNGMDVKLEESEVDQSALRELADFAISAAPLLLLDHPSEYPRPIQLPKEPLWRLPPLWAQSRQEMCESFEWFRSYQSGIYQHNGIVKGYLLGGHPALRDCFECGGKFIISHGGGKSESLHMHKGRAFRSAAVDQTAQDSSVRALAENYRLGQPLVLLIDDKYAHFPYDLESKGVYLAVLGFYRIVHMWAEYQPDKNSQNGMIVRYKFVFEWCEGQGQPWWIEDNSRPEDVSVPGVSEMFAAPLSTSPPKPPHLYFPCHACGELSPSVYSHGWACLSPECNRFWITSSGCPLPEQLTYNPDFISLLDARPLPPAFRDSLFPKPPVLVPQDGVTTSYTSSRGWHCPNCGRLSCRSAWEHCRCPNCNETQKIVGSIRKALPLMSIRVPIANKFVDSHVNLDSNIECLPKRMFLHSNGIHVGHCKTFVLPHDRGKIHLIQNSQVANAEVDRIFEAYQQQAFEGTLLFRRWPLRTHKLRGPLLTNYFSQNSGETYHYVGGADNTVPFDRAPSAVVAARELIQKRIREALETAHQFNEVLSAAYMQQQKMAFHSDSERGLGPVVAGLSMGSPALMHFRLLAKYAKEPEKLEEQDEQQDHLHELELEQEFEQKPEEERRKLRRNVMTVVLRHGDVLVMEGDGVQKYYEHTVIPYNFRIAATARWINPNQSQNAVRSLYQM